MSDPTLPSLPISLPAVTDVATSAPRAAPALPRAKCLIVDDLPENLLALSELLRADDIEVLQASSGREALELLLVHDVALALLDVQMPELDGFELAELMRGSERTRHVPLIFVTAAARDRQRMFKGYDSGAVDFLYKPIEPHVLQSKVGVFVQLHRQKQQLALQLRERSETLRLNEMFMAVLGHDLRGPLAAITMAARLLSTGSADERVQKTAERLSASAAWMNRMVSDLLDLARTRVGGGLAIERRPVDLAALALRVVEERGVATPGRRIELQTVGDLHIAGDADRLVQVMSNLVGNALQHGAADEPVDVRLDGTSEAWVRLSVSNGGSIAPAVLPHIFDPFRSAEQRSGRAESLGLGLYIVRTIVLAHGGEIEVDTAVAGRTTFRIGLPRAAD